MDLPPDLAEPPFDQRVHVLVTRLPGEPVEQPLRLAQLAVAQQAGRDQALGVRARRLDVVEEELRVVCAQERVDLWCEPVPTRPDQSVMRE